MQGCSSRGERGEEAEEVEEAKEAEDEGSREIHRERWALRAMALYRSRKSPCANWLNRPQGLKPH